MSSPVMHSLHNGQLYDFSMAPHVSLRLVDKCGGLECGVQRRVRQVFAVLVE